MDKIKQYFDKPITDVIKSRTSIRTYKEDKLSDEIKLKLINYAKDIKGPFDPKFRFEIIDGIDTIEKTGGKIGTYGVIKGAKSYIAGIVENGEYSIEQLGYTFEKLMLYATSLDIGTCWLGGTFTRSGFEKMANLKDNELMPAVTPIGYIENKKRMLDRVMRTMAGSNNRKEWSDIFFNKSFDNPLIEQEAEKYLTALEMVRIGPSASNKQPWRIVKDNDTFHFYLRHDKGYGKALGLDIQKIDIGIAMCHFEMTLNELGVNGSWVVDKPKNIEYTIDTEYIVSWKN
jgi:hypothetical protein